MSVAPKPGRWILTAVMPIKENAKCVGRADIASFVEQFQKARKIDDIVALEPGIAEIAIVEPMLQVSRVEEGFQEVEPTGFDRRQIVQGTEAVIGQMKTDIALGLFGFGSRPAGSRPLRR